LGGSKEHRHEGRHTEKTQRNRQNPKRVELVLGNASGLLGKQKTNLVKCSNKYIPSFGIYTVGAGHPMLPEIKKKGGLSLVTQN